MNPGNILLAWTTRTTPGDLYIEYTHTITAVGEYSIHMRASNVSEELWTQERTVTIVPPPTATITTPLSGPRILEPGGTMITIIGWATDAAKLEAVVNGQTVGISSDPLSIWSGFTATQAGEYRIRLRATPFTGCPVYSNEVVVTVYSAGTQPIVALTTPTFNHSVNAQTSFFRIEGYAINANILELRINGHLVSSVTGQVNTALLMSYEFYVPRGIHTILLTARNLTTNAAVHSELRTVTAGEINAAVHARTTGNVPGLWYPTNAGAVNIFFVPIRCPLIEVSDRQMWIDSMQIAKSAWTASNSRGVSINTVGLFNSENRVTVKIETWEAPGSIESYFSGHTRHWFTIEMNSGIINLENDDVTNLENYITSVFAHEIGHALGLGDLNDEMGFDESIMNVERDRNVLKAPTKFDIDNMELLY
jgi:hypothetical protein